MSGKRKIDELLNEIILIIRGFCQENNESYNKIALYLISNILNIDRAKIVSFKDLLIDENDYLKVIDASKKYAMGYPLQYCTNKAYFMGLEFYVDERVLIPRFDTETLIDVAFELFKERKNLYFLDIGTGSGCIAISLARYFDCHVLAVDISKDAIDVAKKNALMNGVKDRVEFLVSDIYDGIKNEQKFDAIFSNPPYISKDEINSIDKKVLKEPHTALFSPEDGYYYIKEIAKKSKEYLKEGGYLILEIGYCQFDEAKKILYEYDFTNINSKKDANGINRCIYGVI